MKCTCKKDIMMKNNRTFLILWFIFLWFATPASGQQQGGDVFVVPLEDEVYIYHNQPMSAGQGFHIYRSDAPGAPYERLNEQIVTSARRTDELRPLLGDRYEDVLRFYEVETAGELWMAMRSRPVESNFATALFPEMARALGRLFVDETAPRDQQVSYRIEFVNIMGQPTGQELTTQSQLQTITLPVPRITRAENTARRVVLHWNYPRAPRDRPDFVIQFLVLRVNPSNGDYELLTDDFVIRNNATEEHFIAFDSPVINTTEQYVVKAVDFTGRYSAPSPVFSYDLIDNVAPAMVQDLQARTTREQWVELNWKMSSDPDVAGYRVYRGTDMSEDFELLNEQQLPVSQPFFIDSTARGGRTNFYYVTAQDAAGNESEQGGLAMAQVLDLLPPPTPENFRAEYNELTGLVELSWDMESFSDNFESFILMRRRIDGAQAGAYARINHDHLRETVYNDPGEAGTGFLEGAKYRYVIYSASKAKNYSDTVALTFQIPILTPPDPPSGLTTINDNGMRVQISWNASLARNLEGYRVYRKALDDQDYEALLQVPSTKRYVRDEGLEPGGTYLYTVTALDVAGNESDFSVADTLFFRNYNPPRSVRNVQAAAREEGVVLQWERVVAQDLAGYKVYRAATPTGIYEPLHQGLLTETRFTDPHGEQGMWYRVRAVDTSGNESRPGSPVQPISMAGQ